MAGIAFSLSTPQAARLFINIWLNKPGGLRSARWLYGDQQLPEVVKDYIQDNPKFRRFMDKAGMNELELLNKLKSK